MKTILSSLLILLSITAYAQNGHVIADDGVIVGGNDSQTTDGTIIYDGTDFMGLKSGDWKSLTGGTVPNVFMSTNLNNAAYNLDYANGWTAIGPSFNFTKENDETIVELDLSTRVSIASISPGFGVQFELRLDGMQGDHISIGSVLTGNLTDNVTMKSIFESLDAGTYVLQVYARAPNFGSIATNVILDPGGWAEEFALKNINQE